GGGRSAVRPTAPALPGSARELVAALDHPPGNIAVPRPGRVFFTFHPGGEPPMAVAELIGGKPSPYPDAAFQERYQSVLSLRIDGQGRRWALDYAHYGWGQPRLLAFDLESNAVVHEYDFPSEVAGLFSMLNDFQVDPAGEKIYIAESNPIRQKPALVVYDIAT